MSLKLYWPVPHHWDSPARRIEAAVGRQVAEDVERRILGVPMTESDWLTSADPQRMLEVVQFGAPGMENVPYLATPRKLRLFAVACCRQVWDGVGCGNCPVGDVPDPYCPNCHGTGYIGGLTDERSRRAVEVAERYADGEATEKQMAHWRQRFEHDHPDPPEWGWLLVHNACRDLRYFGDNLVNTYRFIQPAIQAALLRDIFGNPWRPVAKYCRRCDGTGKLIIPALPRGWQYCPHCNGRRHPLAGCFEWRDGTVPRLAQAAYDDRRADGTLDPTRLMVLADALEEAGCADTEILGHLRGPGPHVRGCWALDLILGRS